MNETELVPPTSLGGSIRAILQSTCRDIPGCRSLVIGDPNGLPVAAVGKGDSPRTTAMATLAFSAATRAMEGLGLQRPSQILIEAGEWAVLVLSLGGGFTLFAVVPADGDRALAKAVLAGRGQELRGLLGSGRR